MPESEEEEATAPSAIETAPKEAATPPPGYFDGFPFDSAPFAIAPIQTARLLLRPLAASDSDDVWQYQQLDDVLTYIPWPRRTFAEAAAHTRTRAAQHMLDSDGSSVFFACELGATEQARANAGTPEASTPHANGRVVGDVAQRVIGDVMLRVSSVKTAELEIGWLFHPDFAGSGYATEAAEAVQRLAFDGIGAHRLIAHLDPRNTASARLCARLGMVHEATLREAYYGKGEWSDTSIFAMVAGDWRAREDAPASHTP